MKEGHNQFRTWNNKTKAWEGNVDVARDYLSRCAAFLREKKHPAAARVQVWAAQGDMGVLGDAINCTDNWILQPLAQGLIVDQPNCAKALP